jgi:glycosyltransferase involved in cell wall biosynthesis
MEVRTFVSANFEFDSACIVVGHSNIGPADIVIATNWPTAPIVEALPNARVKMYFVQDYEPSFYEEGQPEYLMAEKTYNLNLAIVTIGAYLEKRLQPYQRFIRSVPFAVDEVFHSVGRERRVGCSADSVCSILFFARPGIPRRNFKAGVEGLTKLFGSGRNVRILLYGMEEELALPFPYVNLGVLDQDSLAGWMGRSDIHLSFSMTNISTVIYEAMAAGCACVEADVEAVRDMVRDGEDCVLATPDGEGVYRALDRLVGDAELRRAIAEAGRRFAAGLSNDAMCGEFSRHVRESWMLADGPGSTGAAGSPRSLRSAKKMARARVSNS